METSSTTTLTPFASNVVSTSRKLLSRAMPKFTLQQPPPATYTRRAYPSRLRSVRMFWIASDAAMDSEMVDVSVSVMIFVSSSSNIFSPSWSLIGYILSKLQRAVNHSVEAGYSFFFLTHPSYACKIPLLCTCRTTFFIFREDLPTYVRHAR